MTRLVLIGAGGFGRELLAWANDIRGAADTPGWDEVAFLDTDLTALDRFSLSAPVIGDPLHYKPAPGDVFACGIGDPATKLRVCRSLQDRGARFPLLSHPTAVVGERCRLGEGVVLCPGAVVTTDATLGDFVMLNVAARVGHDATLGAGCTLSGGCDVTGGAALGEGVFMGTNAAMLPGAEAGDYAKIAAGSVVFRRAPAGATVCGNPAKRLPAIH